MAGSLSINRAFQSGSKPLVTFELDLPQRPAEVSRRMHNTFAKNALRTVLQKHHALHVPEHFRRPARTKYGYAKRQEPYMRQKAKKYHSTVDLVKTGDSRNQMLSQGKITLGGAAEGGKSLTGTLNLRFSFRGGAGRFKRGTKDSKRVPIKQMIKEMQATTDSERRNMAGWFKQEYMGQYQNFLSTRQRARLPTT